MAKETKVAIEIEASQKTGAITATGTELDKLKGNMDQAKAGAEGLGEGMGKAGEATEALQSSIAQFISVAAISAFFKEAVAASLQEEEALRIVRGAIESTGQSWEKYGDVIEKFAATQQAQTRFDDTVTFEVLGKLARATKTVEQAMSATVLAQNLSVATGKSLAASSEIVSDLMLGQTRAIIQATKAFGSYAGTATTTQGVLDSLQKSVSGAAAAEESFTKQLAQNKNFLGDFQQKVGDGLVPVLAVLATSLSFVVKGWEQLGEAIGGGMAVAATVFTTHAEVMGAVIRGRFGEAALLAVQGKDKLITIAEETAAGIAAIEARFSGKGGGGNAENERLIAAQDAATLQAASEEKIKIEEAAAAKKLEIQQTLSSDVNASINDELTVKLMAIDAQIAAAEQAGVREIEVMVEGQAQKMSLTQAHDELVTQAAEAAAEKLLIVKTTADTKEKALANKKAADVERQRATDLQNRRATLSAISTLASSKNKELAAIGKAAAIALTTIDTGRAIMGAWASLSNIPIVGVPLAIAASALVATAGAAQIAAITGVQLEHGGVVPGSAGGTAATIGEKGRAEAVLPLESPRAMEMVGKAIADAGGSGGGGTNIFYITVTAQVPEWRSIMEAIAEEAERGSPEIIRVASRLSDLAQLNAGRSS